VQAAIMRVAEPRATQTSPTQTNPRWQGSGCPVALIKRQVHIPVGGVISTGSGPTGLLTPTICCSLLNRQYCIMGIPNCCRLHIQIPIPPPDEDWSKGRCEFTI